LNSGFAPGLLGALAVLASGYLLYHVPLLHSHWYRRTEGYVLYFRIIVTGTLLSSLAVGFFPYYRSLFPDIPLPNATFIAALALWLLFFFMEKALVIIFPKLRDTLNLNRLEGQYFETFIYEKNIASEMIMITLENRKIYIGWPLGILVEGQENKWLRLIPFWSGCRDEKGIVEITTKYDKAFRVTDKNSRSEQQESIIMLIPVDKISVLQPFYPDLWDAFHSNAPGTPGT